MARLAHSDDWCGYCEFEGRWTKTFAYSDAHGAKYHWCSWHQIEVPPLSVEASRRRKPSVAPALMAATH